MDDPELFDLAMRLPPQERAVAIREACGYDVQREALMLELLELAEAGESTRPVTEEPERPGLARLPQGELIGRYVVTSFLGQGAFGQVYEAFDLELVRRVALKILREDRGVPDQDERRFRREAQSLAQIDHPNVVRVYDAGVHDGRHYLTMELVRGTSLRSWIAAASKRRWTEVLDTLLPAARGLQAAHAAGIIHRDFKPENVMIEPGGRVVVTDFGIARMTSGVAFARTGSDSGPPSPHGGSPTSTRSVMGTPFYMAPEQLEGRATPRSDEYAFCRVLLEALGHPGRGTDPAEPAADRGNAASSEHPDVRAPRWLRRVLARGLEPDEQRRFPDMAALLRAIERHRASRRWSARSLVVLGLGSAIAFGLMRTPPPACRQWDEQAVQQAFDGTWSALADRGPQVAAVQGMVQWNLGAWARARTDACEQHVNGLVDTATARARDECFARWHDELKRGLSWWVEQPKAEGSAVRADELPRNPTRCAYVDAPEVDQPDLAPELRDALERELAESFQHRLHGDYSAGVRAAERALRLAEDAGHDAYRAEIHLRLGVLAARIHDPERAIQLLQRSLVDAERLGLDALAAEAHASMAETIALATTMPPALAEQGLALARAKVERHGERHDELEPELWAIEGHIAHMTGDYPRAERAYQRAIEQFDRLNGPLDYRAAAVRASRARTLSALGRHDEALALAEAALTTRRQAIGDAHPLIADDWLALGMLYGGAASASAPERARAHWEAAEAKLQEAAASMRRRQGPSSWPLANALAELTEARMRLGKFDEAVAQDVRDFVEILDRVDPREVTPAGRTRALRIARNFHHRHKDWGAALATAERLAEQPSDPLTNDDELQRVQYLHKLGRDDEARELLSAHERRHGTACGAESGHHGKLEKLRRKLTPPPSDDHEDPPP